MWQQRIWMRGGRNPVGPVSTGMMNSTRRMVRVLQPATANNHQASATSITRSEAMAITQMRQLAYLSKKKPTIASEPTNAAVAAPTPSRATPTTAGKSLYGRNAAAPSSSSSSVASAASASNEDTTFDVIIIGAGSGGLALSKEASLFGQKVLILDYVEPTIHGSKWGLGGTCVNVGCIPKKLMHQTAMVGDTIREAHKFGWSAMNATTVAADDIHSTSTHSSPKQLSPDAKVEPIQAAHQWSTLVSGVQQYIRSLNFGYRSRLTKDPRITYANMRGSLLTSRTVQGTDSKGNTKIFTARKHIIIAVGGKPKYPHIDGAELGITSDDIFSLSKPPGKTLIVGAGYIALESAGFLAGLGFDTTVMARSLFLRGFDRNMAELIVGYMKDHSGVKFLQGFIPKKLEKSENSDGRILVTYAKGSKGSSDYEEKQEEFDTVMFAIGRVPRTEGLGLEKVGIATEPDSHSSSAGKILLQDEEGRGLTNQSSSSSGDESFDPDQTNVNGVYAIGDVAKNRPELTPVAISSARMLARRLYDQNKSNSNNAGTTNAIPTISPLTLDYWSTPTTVFTPLEYSCVGWSEEEAIRRFGGREEAIEVYHSYFRPLEWALPEGDSNRCYVKVIVARSERELADRKQQMSCDSKETEVSTSNTNPQQHQEFLSYASEQKVLGLHFLGPNAGEVMQGFSVAFRKGLTKSDLDASIGIHPTTAEELLSLEITKSSGVDPQKTGC